MTEKERLAKISKPFYDELEMEQKLFHTALQNEKNIEKLKIKIINTTDDEERKRLCDKKFELELRQFKLNRTHREFIIKMGDKHSKSIMKKLGKLTDKDREKIQAIREAGLRRMASQNK